MIVECSRPRLLPSVQRDENGVVDRALGRSIGLNKTAKHIVHGIDGTRSVGEIASGLSRRFGVEEHRALADTTELIEALYRGGLVRARPPWGYWLAYLTVILRTFDTGFLKGLLFARKRVDIRGDAFLVILVQVTLRVAVRYSWLAAYVVLVGGAPLLLLGRDAAGALLIPFILCSVLLLGLSLHESAHLYVLRRRTSDRWLGYLSLTTMEVSIRRPQTHDERLEHEVAASGPLCPVACGVFLLALNACHPGFLLAASGLLLTVHVLSLIPLSSDGKKLFSHAFAPRHTEEYHER